jgi:hypothetical protein
MGIIQRFGIWLDKRWPEQVVIDKALHMAMIEDIKVLALGIDSVNKRIDDLVKKTEIVERKTFISQADR